MRTSWRNPSCFCVIYVIQYIPDSYNISTVSGNYVPRSALKTLDIREVRLNEASIVKKLPSVLFNIYVSHTYKNTAKAFNMHFSIMKSRKLPLNESKHWTPPLKKKIILLKTSPVHWLFLAPQVCVCVLPFLFIYMYWPERCWIMHRMIENVFIGKQSHSNFMEKVSILHHT